MKYDVFIVIKKRFVVLLINLNDCKIDVCEKVDEKIKNAINKNMRENVINFDRETTFVHNIDFFNVVIEKIKKIKVNEKINEKSDENEKNEKDFFV